MNEPDLPLRTPLDQANGRGCLVFFIFAALGPPLIGLVFVIVGIAMAMPEVRQMSHAGSLLGTASFIMLMSYWVAGIQAVIVGVVAGIAQSRTRSQLVPVVPVLLASLATGVAFMIFVSMRSPSNEHPSAYTIAAFIGLHLAGGTVAWLLSNAILWPFRRRTSPPTQT